VENPRFRHLIPFMKHVEFEILLDEPMYRYVWEIKLICKLFQYHGQRPIVRDVFRHNNRWGPPMQRSGCKRSATKRKLINRLQSFVQHPRAGEIETGVCADIAAVLRNVSVV
jgi:hypothetical protein